LLLVALALSLWSHRRERAPLPAPVRASEASSSNGTPGGTGGKSDISASTAPPSTSAQASPTNAQPGAAPAPRNASVSSGSPSSALNPGEFSVAIHAREDSWISINADGKTSSELLVTGSDRTVRARQEIIARVGNAGGVDLRFNGKKVDTDGQFGDVETLTFGPGGLVPSTPSSPSTH
jgi:cytoskeleton protein RodZ